MDIAEVQGWKKSEVLNKWERLRAQGFDARLGVEVDEGSREAETERRNSCEDLFPLDCLHPKREDYCLKMLSLKSKEIHKYYHLRFWVRVFESNDRRQLNDLRINVKGQEC